MEGKKTRQSIVKAFNAAIEGIIYTFKKERNMKIHYCVALVILISSLFCDFSKTERVLLLFTISLVVISEMFNTAVENTVDMITDDYHPLAKIAKDVAAGGVLIASLNAVVVGYILFYDILDNIGQSVFYSIRKSELHITVICIVIVLIAVVVVKALTATGTPLRGGMPSGHAALAFALATCVAFMTERVVAATLAYLMAALVAQSRIEGKIHSFWETVAGSLLGILVALLITQMSLFY